MRQTSVDTYHAIRDNGLLTKRRLEVYQILYKYGPLTAHEVVDVARSKYPLANQTGFNARLSELKTQEAVEEVGVKINKVSNKKNILWDVTGTIPKLIPKKETNTQVITRLESRIAELEQMLGIYRG